MPDHARPGCSPMDQTPGPSSLNLSSLAGPDGRGEGAGGTRRPHSDARSSDVSRRGRGAVPLETVGQGMVVRHVSVSAPEVVFVKGLVEASDGLAGVFAERGGELLLVSPFGREAELGEFISDLEADVGARLGVEGGAGVKLRGMTSRAGAITADETDGDTGRDRASGEAMADGGPSNSAEPFDAPTDNRAGVDPRLRAAWKEWLRALATDADAAIAAAQVYQDLDDAGREAWLDALAEDAPSLSVPAVAIYAPLLAVESDPSRRARIELSIVSDLDPASDPRRVRAVRGIAGDGARVLALVSPLYLDFVDVLWCRYFADDGFVWVRHDALLGEKDAPRDGTEMEDVVLEATPLTPVIEELAHAVLAQRRHGRELPASLHLFAHLFDAHIESDPGLE